MTAIVGFMNKRGVAIAADSAVTLGNTHKVVNSGNKIFTLSKYAPVGIASYGNDSFMGTPWEIIIKLFRSRLKKIKYDTLEAYINAFIDFLHQEKFFIDDNFQKTILLERAKMFYNISVEHIKQYDKYTEKKAVEFLKQELQLCERINSNDNNLKFYELRDYSYEHFLKYFSEIFMANLCSMPLLNSEDLKSIFLQSFFHYLLVHVDYNTDSGLVFFGYGEKEIFPSMINIIVTDSFDDRLRYLKMEGNSGSITNDGVSAVIIPYAQIDVTQTIIRGINPTFINVLGSAFVEILNGYREIILSQIPTTSKNNDVRNKISSVNHDALAKVFIDNATKEFRESYTSPLINTVASLSKEDMANLAESFVELTSLVRRMSPHEETVGGPVDVAVVSKGDGFIWLKRKHYFDPQLNSNFFKNYNDEK